MMRDLIVMTDERLDHLADRFLMFRVRELVHVNFGQYLRDPDHYDSLAVQETARGSVHRLLSER